MTGADSDGQAAAANDRCLALLAVSEAIVSHRDLSALFHELAERLHQVVRFDYLAVLVHEAATNTMRLHALEALEPIPPPPSAIPIEGLPPGWAWQTQRPLIISNVSRETRWPGFAERAAPYRVQSCCYLPLT